MHSTRWVVLLLAPALLFGCSGASEATDTPPAAEAGETPRADEATGTPAASWEAPIQAANRAMEEERWADAARLFAEADEALGGYPYEEDPPRDDAGEWIHREERGPIRDTIQCPWVLALAHAGELAEGSEELELAHARLSSANCSRAERARFALHTGHPRTAAILVSGLDEARDPALREYASWAASVASGRFPVAPDLPTAIAWVTASMRATHGLGSSCHMTRPRAARRPDTSTASDDATRYLVEDPTFDDDDGEEEVFDPEAAVATFRFDRALPITTVVCPKEFRWDPYEGSSLYAVSTLEYLLEQRPDGVQVVGSFEGFPERDCTMDTAEAYIGQERIAIGRGQNLYLLTRVQGYGSHHEQSSQLIREIIACDPVRLACGQLPTRFVADRDMGAASHEQRAFRANASFSGGAVRLSGADDMPPELERYRAGVPLDVFFSEAPPDVDSMYEAWLGDFLWGASARPHGEESSGEEPSSGE